MPRHRVRVQQGFTLIELLVVMAIVGVLATVVFLSLLRARNRQQLQEGARQLATDLSRARAQAQLSSQSSVVALVSSNANRYTTQWRGAAAITRTLPYNLTVAAMSSATTAAGSTSLTYTAPYGTLDVDGVVWRVTSPALNESLFVKAVGVTGKVLVTSSYDD
ncbi:type II secretion system protein [Deinococcus sonorensis]|uniref:Type II secretion system protein n=2 Tax=Deinococcus sonorensis TaxID=309891 RepID=A0AAU7U6Y9_9DEIO